MSYSVAFSAILELESVSGVGALFFLTGGFGMRDLTD
jgi:hypothetical protein